MNARFILKTLLLFAVVVLSSYASRACEVDFEILEGKKEAYAVGDEMVVKVKITLIHRNCTVNIKNTEYKQDGIKIKSGTDWKEVSPGVWERKLKVVVENPKAEKANLSVSRKCDKEGGFGTFSVAVKK
jgi:hypothetical protein